MRCCECIAMLLEAWSLPYLSLLTWIIFCVREEITSKWSRISFPLNVFVCPLLRMPGQEHQPGKGRRTNQKPVNQTLKTKKELAWMCCSPAQPSRWDGDPSWNQVKDVMPIHISTMEEYTPNFKSLWERFLTPNIKYNGKSLRKYLVVVTENNIRS